MMKYIKLFENYNKHVYPISVSNVKSFINILNKYLPSKEYKIINNEIQSKEDISDIIEGALRVYKSLHKNEIIIEKYEDIFKYKSEQYVDEFGFEGFNTRDDAIEHLDYLFKTKYPYGYLNVPKEMKLYRVLFVESEKDINKNDLGFHFIPNKKLIDGDFIFSIGGENFDWEETPPHLVEVLVDRDEINWSYSIANNLKYPYEWEITMKNKSPKITIIKISLFKI